MTEKFDIYSKIFYRDVEKFVRSTPVSFGPASPDAGVELLRQLFLQCRLLPSHKKSKMMMSLVTSVFVFDG